MPLPCMELPGWLQRHTWLNIQWSVKLPKWREWSLLFHIYAIVNGVSYPHLVLNPQPVLDWMPSKKNNNSFQLWILPFVMRFESPSQRRGISFSVFFHMEKGGHTGITLLCSVPFCCQDTAWGHSCALASPPHSAEAKMLKCHLCGLVP